MSRRRSKPLTQYPIVKTCPEGNQATNTPKKTRNIFIKKKLETKILELGVKFTKQIPKPKEETLNSLTIISTNHQAPRTATGAEKETTQKRAKSLATSTSSATSIPTSLSSLPPFTNHQRIVQKEVRGAPKTEDKIPTYHATPKPSTKKKP